MEAGNELSCYYGDSGNYEARLEKEVNRKIIGAFRNPIIPTGRIPEYRMVELAELPYKEYLTTREWRAIRNYMRELSVKCAMCGRSNKNLQVHHNNYPRRGTETPYDLVALCEQCHKKHHFAGGRLLSDDANKKLDKLAEHDDWDLNGSCAFLAISLAMYAVGEEVVERRKLLDKHNKEA